MPIVTMPNGDRVNFPDDMSKDDIQAKIRSKFPEAVDSGWRLAGDELMGLGKGAAKGVARLAESLPTLGVPHVSELDPNAKKFIESPNATYGEAIGEFAGENAPFLVGGPEAAIGKGVARAIPIAGRLAKPIGEVVGHTLWGGAAGAAQPVKPGESRLENAAGGALTAGTLTPSVFGKLSGVAGGAAAGLGVEHLIRQFGFWPVVGALGSLGVGSIGHFGLHGLATKAAKMTQGPGKAIASGIPAGVAGAAGGRATEAAQENQ